MTSLLFKRGTLPPTLKPKDRWIQYPLIMKVISLLHFKIDNNPFDMCANQIHIKQRFAVKPRKSLGTKVSRTTSEPPNQTSESQHEKRFTIFGQSQKFCFKEIRFLSFSRSIHLFPFYKPCTRSANSFAHFLRKKFNSKFKTQIVHIYKYSVLIYIYTLKSYPIDLDIIC